MPDLRHRPSGRAIHNTRRKADHVKSDTVSGLPFRQPMASPSPPPPSAALWGGWYANVFEMSTFDTPSEQEVFLRENALVQALARVEETTNIADMCAAVRRIPEETVMQLNSPLLDNLRNVSQGWTLLKAVKYTGSASAVSFCLDRGADIHADNDSALRWAGYLNLKDVCELLLDRGANVHAMDDAALFWAASKGNTEVVRVLLEHGADVHSRQDEALRYAASAGHKDVCKLLLDSGADIHARSDEAVRRARGEGHEDVVALLESRGARLVQ